MFRNGRLALSQCLVYLGASGDEEESVKLLKGRRWLLDYDPRISVNARLMLRVLGVGDGAKLKEVVEGFKPLLSPEFWPALLMLAGRMQKEEALEECAQSPSEVCVDAVAATVGNHEAVERLRSEIEREVPETHPLLDKADERTLVEAPVPEYSLA